MAKQYEPPAKNAKVEDEVTEDKQVADANKQAAEAEKKQKAYIDKLNEHLKAVVDAAGAEKDSNPQFLNFAVSALRNAADQIEAVTPQGKAHHNL